MAGTDRDKQLINEGPAIILVEPQLGENIGMVARAMANFGLGELRLVSPRDGWPNEKARAASAGAIHVIDGVIVFASLREAIADLNYVVATTARERDRFKPVLGPVEAGARLRHFFRQGQKTGILLGRERFGLDNDEVALADEIVTFPVNPAFASLNIAQATLLISYEWMKSGLKSETDTAFRGPEVQQASKEALNGLIDHLDTALTARGYFRPAPRKPKMLDSLRAVLTRPGFSDAEIRVLRGVVASLDYYTPQGPRGSHYPQRKAKVDSMAHMADKEPEKQRAGSDD